jgi:uncharacterized protein YdhG (YjbR/CyaY superfamily)
MQYDVNSVNDYLDALESDWRKEKLLQVRTLLMECFPELEEGINYKMLCYRFNDEPVFHLNAQQKFIGFYVGDIQKIDPTNQIGEHFNVGKGCVRISKTKQVVEGPFKTFVLNATAHVKSGKDHSC